MKKQILEHISFMETQINKLDGGDNGALGDLGLFNEKMIENFRHERIVHLVITLFFAFMAVLWFTVTLFLINTGTSEYISEYMVILLGVLTILFMIVDGFYIKHYYFLENSIQKLYKYNVDIYTLRSKE